MIDPFIKNSVNKFVAIWFPPAERVFVTTVIIFNLIFGYIMAMVLPGIVFNGYEPKDDNKDYTEGKKHFHTLYLILAIAGTVIVIVSLIFFRSGPEFPPSLS